MADVAARAGVSVMTVSRVINDYPGVREETRARVQKVIDSLGYRSNTAARTLAGGRSRIIGVIGVETSYFGPSHTIFGIEAAARSRGLGTSWTTIHLVYEEEAAAILGIPHETITQVALIPIAHTIGDRFQPAPRLPLDTVLHWDAW